MARGRIPKPKAINDLKGDSHKRRRHLAEPEPSKDKPVCPEYLDEVGRAEWHSVTTQLESMGLLSKTDSTALELYAGAYSRYRQAEAKVRDGLGVMLGKDTDFPMITAYQTIMNQSLEVCRKLLIEFGLTPAARSRIAVPAVQQSATSWEGIIKIQK